MQVISTAAVLLAAVAATSAQHNLGENTMHKVAEKILKNDDNKHVEVGQFGKKKKLPVCSRTCEAKQCTVCDTPTSSPPPPLFLCLFAPSHMFHPSYRTRSGSGGASTAVLGTLAARVRSPVTPTTRAAWCTTSVWEGREC